jgi:hypothetical protein
MTATLTTTSTNTNEAQLTCTKRHLDNSPVQKNHLDNPTRNKTT